MTLVSSVCQASDMQKMLARIPFFNVWIFPAAEVAQLVEQGTENPRVGSSILSLGTTR